jgi:PPE-repeat protein
MYGYAGSASTATDLAPFHRPPQTTNPAGTSSQTGALTQAAGTSTAHNAETGASALGSSVPQQLQALSAAGTPAGSPAPLGSWSVSAWPSDLQTLLGPAGFVIKSGLAAVKAAQFAVAIQSIAPSPPTTAAAAPAVTGGTLVSGDVGVRAPVLAGVGKAAPVGKLAVPKSWAAATAGNGPAAPAANPVSEPLRLTGTDLRAAPASNPQAMGPPPMGSGAGGGRSGNLVLRMRDRRFRMPRPVVGG